jgi:hypothetical protein
MKTNHSPDRFIPEPQAPEAPQTPINNTLDTNEQAQAAPAATEPLSPQFAALAKAKRALQVKERELAVREAQLGKTPDKTSGVYTKDEIKTQALRILRESGVTNDELTEALLREAQDYGPGYTALEAEIKTIKDQQNAEKQLQAERDQAAERQVLTHMRSQIDELTQQGEQFELTRLHGYQPKVLELIYKTYKSTGEIYDVDYACKLIEDEPMADTLKAAQVKKVQSSFTTTPLQTQTQPTQRGQVPTQTMRTLTNRDNASTHAMSRRERAIQAFYGKK